MARRFPTVGVVGLGAMGSGIAEVLARCGHRVIGVEIDEPAMTRARARIERSTRRAVSGGKLDGDGRRRLLAEINYTTSLSDLADAALVIEAVPERFELKAALLARIDGIVGPDVILASDTSLLSVTEIGERTGRPGKVIGTHFFNPAPVRQLVEVVRRVVTEPQTVDDVTELLRELGKEPVVIGDRAGFIVNALLFPYLNDAVRMVAGHYASADEIDTAMWVGCGLPMGPFQLLDVVGHDVALVIQRTLFNESRDAGFAPAPLLEHLVTAGRLGRKTGKGFRNYT